MSGVRRDDTCQNLLVRTETWNLEGKGSSDRLALLEGHECDVRLLTQMPSEAVDREVLALGLLATSDGGAT